MRSSELAPLVWQLVASIPPGRVATYGQIARQCGSPGHARLVGRILSQLPADTELPWHRVINAGGRSSFPVGSDRYQLQITRLEQEGLILDNGRVSQCSAYWINNQA